MKTTGVVFCTTFGVYYMLRILCYEENKHAPGSWGFNYQLVQ